MEAHDLQGELIEEFNADRGVRTPENLARRLGVTLAEVREAEKTALQKLADPAQVEPATLSQLGLTALEHDVLVYLYCRSRRRTPEDLAREFNVPLATVLEAKKAAMREVQDTPRQPIDHA